MTRGCGGTVGSPPVIELLLLRHGQSEWNALGRWQGQADPPLTDLGRTQARHAAAMVHGITGVYSSDLQRAAQTADILAAGLGLTVTGRLAALRERHAGPWQGLTHDEIEVSWPGYLDTGRRPPGFEADEQILARVVPALQTLADSVTEARIVAVTHGGVLRALDRSHGLDRARVPNLGGRWWSVTGDGLVGGAEVVLVRRDEMTRPEET